MFSLFPAYEHISSRSKIATACETIKEELFSRVKYFNEQEYLDMLMSFTSEPQKYYKQVIKYSNIQDQKFINKGVTYNSIGTSHKLACRHLYGMYG